MADESKAPQSPESSQPELSGSSPAPSAAGASPSPPAKAATPPPLQVPLDNELSRRYRERFDGAILGAIEDRKQSILIVDATQLLEIARYSRDEEKFDLLEDYTAVDWPRREKRFDLVAQLYSFTHNTRLRLKIPLGVEEQPSTLVPIWPAANWLEWQGHPLCKDYDILQQDTAWVRENLGIDSGK
jgi:NADH:ubiquinone oxidoreductase subunit C